MKIIIQDYTTNKCSESRMIYTELQNNSDVESFLWNDKDQISAYDFMDSVDPDFVIINAANTNQDLVHYAVANNIGKKIILKIPSSIKKEQLSQIAQNSFVQNHVMMTLSDNQLDKIRNVNLKPCVDINIQDITIKKRIPLCIVTETGDITPQLLGLSKSFHVISNTQEKGVDLYGPNITTAGLYGNYDTVIFDKITKFEQPFFDSLYRTKTLFTSDDCSMSEKSTLLFNQNLNMQDNKDVDFKAVKEHLKEKHIPKNRVKQLLSQMPIDQSIFTEVAK